MDVQFDFKVSVGISTAEYGISESVGSMFVEHLLCARHCSRYYWYSSETKQTKILLPGVRGNKRKNNNLGHGEK